MFTACAHGRGVWQLHIHAQRVCGDFTHCGAASHIHGEFAAHARVFGAPQATGSRHTHMLAGKRAQQARAQRAAEL